MTPAGPVGQSSEDFSITWRSRGEDAELLAEHTVDTVGPELVEVFTDRDGSPQGAIIQGDCAQLASLERPLADLGLGLNSAAQLIYLDPPYNRGGNFSTYSDKMPRYEWLSFIERRIRVAHALLAPIGTLWVQLDDSEAHRVRCLLDEIFGTKSFIADITVECNPKGRQLDKFFAGSHDRLMVYARDISQTELKSGTPEGVNPEDFPHTDTEGVRYRLLPLRNTNKRFNPRTAPSMTYPLYGNADTGEVRLSDAPGFTEILPIFGDLSPAVWRWSEAKAAENLGQLECRTVNGRLGRRVDIYQRDRHFDGRIKKLKTMWLSEEVGSTDTARAELRRLGIDTFDTPKPSPLLQRIIELATEPGELVVDLFAGSGTTPAVAQQSGRRWIAVEQNPQTIEQVLRPRLRALTNDHTAHS